MLLASSEWVESFKQKVNSNKEMTMVAKGLDATIRFVIQEAGDRGDISVWTHLKDGIVLEAQAGDERESDFSVAGDYSVWRDIIEGREDPIEAVMSQRLSFEGDRQVIMKYLKAVDLIMESIKAVPTEFYTPRLTIAEGKPG